VAPAMGRWSSRIGGRLGIGLETSWGEVDAGRGLPMAEYPARTSRSLAFHGGVEAVKVQLGWVVRRSPQAVLAETPRGAVRSTRVVAGAWRSGSRIGLISCFG